MVPSLSLLSCESSVYVKANPDRKKINSSANINKKQNRTWQIISFSPPFKVKAKTKIGKLFIIFLDKYFPPDNKLYRRFKPTNVKISYSGMANMNSFTYMHNHKVLNNKPNETEIKNCNWPNKDTCPLLNSCRTKIIIYEANTTVSRLVTNRNPTSAYVKEHSKISEIIKRLFNHIKHKYDPELSKELCAMEHQTYMEDNHSMLFLQSKLEAQPFTKLQLTKKITFLTKKLK